jgi:hypothetical protein
VYELSEGEEESAYDDLDRMRLEPHEPRALVHNVSCDVCACVPSIRSQLRAGGCKLSLASLAVLALARHSAVGTDGGAPAVHADAPHSVVLADGGAPAVHADAPHSVVLADGGTPLHVLLSRLCSQMEVPLALAPPSVVLTDGGAPTVLACAPLSVVLADGE